jgi:hypothetical protein
MIPEFYEHGNLPPGIHWADWDEIVARFGTNKRRVELLQGLKEAARLLAEAGCPALYVDGSFVTAKEIPGDFDACWELTADMDPARFDPVFWQLRHPRKEQKERFGGELFPAQLPNGASGETFLDFFQVDRDGNPKGVVALKLRGGKA